MKKWHLIVVATSLALVNGLFVSSGLADSKPRAVAESSQVAQAVYRLSEQAKKDGLINIKNHFWDPQEFSKLVPIEPVLGKEIRPDSVE